MLLLPKLIATFFFLAVLTGCQSSSSDENQSPDLSAFNLTLAIESESNANRVKIQPLDKICATACVERISENVQVNLIPLIDEESEFVGWDGDCTGKTCSLTINSDKKVGSVFKQKSTRRLKINIIGQGHLTINNSQVTCDSSCSFNYPTGTQLSLGAIASTNYRFSHWKDAEFGCASSTTCNVSLDNNVYLTIVFEEADDQNLLNLTFLGNGAGEIGVVGHALSCTSDCQLILPNSETIELYADPVEGESVFSAWGGCEQIVDNKCQLSPSQNPSVSATFQRIEYTTLSLDITGNGSIQSSNGLINCSSDCQIEIVKNQPIELLAVADSGHELSLWSNDCSQNISCTINTDVPLAITVTFQESAFNKDSNAILITEPLGETRTNHPIQIGRPFVKGEIANFPVAVINNVEIPTQANVKQRYDDGSVKHAIISFIIDHLPANSSLAVEFKNKTDMSQTGLSKTEILSDSLQFSASMKFVFPEGGTSIVSAENMVNNNHYDVWYEGEIATSILISDHSAQRSYDVGNDNHRSIRPIYYVTFWPTINKYQVRYVVENSNTMTLQDQTYNVELSISNNADAFYVKENVPHQAMSRWTKSQWSGAQVSPLSINHNIRYLTKTKAIANFDTNLVISENIIESDWNKWQSKDKDIYDGGLWQKAMATGGGRQDIGLYPTWSIKWMFTGDWRHQEVALRQSELAAAWPMHLREGDTGRSFDFAETVDAIGKVISMAPKARPTHWTGRPDWHEINEGDKIQFVGARGTTLWRPDVPHHPDIATPQYLLTGEYFYLEEMINSAAFVGGDNNAKATAHRYGRGPTGSEGALYASEVRGQAWAMRARFETEYIIPDDMPEKLYFSRLNKNAISMFEGMFHLNNSYPERSELHEFAKNTVSPNAFSITGVPSPLGFWSYGTNSTNYVNTRFVNTETVSRALAPWMQNFVITVLGRAVELDYKTENLLAYAGQTLLGPFGHSDLQHSLFSAYIVPIQNNENAWFSEWPVLFAQYQSDYVQENAEILATRSDTEHGYYSIGMGAASFLHGHENFDALWSFIESNVKIKPEYANNPKWALLPRTAE